MAGDVLVGRGIYDPTEAARLLRVRPGVLGGWTTGRWPVLRPSGGSWFDFADLVSLLVVVELRRRRVPLGEIRRVWIAPSERVEIAAEREVARRERGGRREREELAHLDEPRVLAGRREVSAQNHERRAALND